MGSGLILVSTVSPTIQLAIFLPPIFQSVFFMCLSGKDELNFVLFNQKNIGKACLYRPMGMRPTVLNFREILDDRIF